ncbi:MAG TPA: peptidoglycan-binding domain-containing protein [Acidimicrobiales bacterium]|jgi:hypothetical protein|nr:peptidoglycan-binding domain-containing protein [Acidimicrobiales bacterium]
MADEIEFTVADTAPVLRRGEHGDWVRYLQQLLETANHPPGPINSSFGEQTEQAVKAFQAWVPIPVTGVVDKTTWQYLIKKSETLEGLDTVRGELAGTADAHDHKLAVGEEVGRAGWRRVLLHCTISDMKDRPFPNANAYVRFTGRDGATSDEGGRVEHGTLRLESIWVPNQGEFHLYVGSTQVGPNGHVGDVAGTTPMKCTGDFVQFTAKQSVGETRTMTDEQARAFGISHSNTVEVGVDVEVISAGGSVTSGFSDETTYGHGESMTVTFPGNGFHVEQV